MTDKEFLQQLRANKNIIHNVCNLYYESASREDLVQEIILELYKSLPNFKKHCTFKTWIYNVARNTCINYLRKNKRHQHLECPEDYADVFSCENSIEITIEQLHNATRYNTVIDSIKDHDRRLFQMYLEGHSFKEIEKRTGTNENNLRVLIYRIKKRLQLRYGAYKNN